MQRRISGILTFFRGFALITLFFTLWCAYCVIVYHDPGYIFLFVILKVVADAAMFYLWHEMRSAQVYYYYNLGLRRRHLLVSMLLIDFLVFTPVLTLIVQCL
jgi:hypothetical protein